jgi:hypothetical protein
VFGNFDHPNGMSHLSTWVSRPELLSAARAFCDTVFDTQRAATRPQARMVLEKTPNHRLQAALQAELYPDARYVHIVRDGRDATASQRELWGSADDEFADADRAAQAWAAAVGDVRAHFGALAYLELRYEDIVADTPGALAAIFDHCGLAHDAELCEAAAAFGRAPVHTSPQSPTVGIRKHAGDALAERAVAIAAGDLLIELGYATPDEVADLRQLRIPRTRKRASFRRKRDAHADDTRRVATALAKALEQSDVTGVKATLDPRAASAAELVTRYGGWRMTQRRVIDDAALLTLVSKDGARAVLRVEVRAGVAAAVESL